MTNVKKRSVKTTRKYKNVNSTNPINQNKIKDKFKNKNEQWKIFTDTFNRVGEEFEKSNIILMKANKFKNLLPVHFNTILAIASFSHPPILIDIAYKMYKSKSDISAIISTLQKKGYVVIINNKLDKRAKNIHLTSKGEKIAKTIEAMWRKHYLVVLKDFTNDEQAKMFEFLLKMEVNLCNFNNQNKIKF